MHKGHGERRGFTCAHIAGAGPELDRRLRESSIPSLAICEHGVVVSSNEIHERLRGPGGAPLVGRHMEEIVGERFSVPTIELARRVILDGRTQTALVMWRGHWMRVRYSRLESPSLACCLIHSDPWRDEMLESPSPPEDPPVEFAVHDLGDLAGVTAREAEVLWMIGQGMTLPAIAKALSRSTKTVETHVRSLGSKLNVRGRFALGHFAAQRGICNMSREQVGRVFADRPSTRE